MQPTSVSLCQMYPGLLTSYYPRSRSCLRIQTLVSQCIFLFDLFALFQYFKYNTILDKPMQCHDMTVFRVKLNILRKCSDQGGSCPPLLSPGCCCCCCEGGGGVCSTRRASNKLVKLVYLFCGGRLLNGSRLFFNLVKELDRTVKLALWSRTYSQMLLSKLS